MILKKVSQRVTIPPPVTSNRCSYEGAVIETVNGMTGMVRGNKLIWQDRNAKLMFTIKAKNMSVSDLVGLAESVSRIE